MPPDPRPGNARLSYRVGGAGPARLFVGFSDDRRLVVLIVLIVLIVLVVLLVVPVVVFVVFVIIVVGVSRRHRVGHDGDEAPFDQPGGNVVGVRGVMSAPVGATFMDGLARELGVGKVVRIVAHHYARKW